MGFGLGPLGRIVIFGQVAPVIAIGTTVVCFAGYGIYRMCKD